MKLSGVLVLFSRFGWRSRRQRFVGVWVRMNLDSGGEEQGGEAKAFFGFTTNPDDFLGLRLEKAKENWGKKERGFLERD